MDFDLDWVLPTGWVDLKSVKFNGFVFGFGLDMAHGSGWISNLYYLTDSDLGSDSDSVLPSGWVGLWI